MEKDVATGRADGFSNADFAGALGDGDEHDIHNPDATDNQGDTSDEGEHAGDEGEEIRGGMRDVFAIGDGEIIVAFFGLFELGFDSFREGREEIGGFGAGGDLLDLESGAEGA